MSIRVLLADDHVLVRAGLRRLLDELDGIEVVGEACDGAEALRLARELMPDVVLLDIAMPELDGFGVAARLPSSKVPTIMLSMYDSEAFVGTALRAGCAGFLTKDAAVSELEVAIRTVARGETYLGASVANGVVSGYVRRTEEPPTLLDGLTRRQCEILRLVAEGHRSKDIAERLGLSVKTIESHRARIMDRLDVHEVTGLVRFAVRAGLVTL